MPNELTVNMRGFDMGEPILYPETFDVSVEENQIKVILNNYSDFSKILYEVGGDAIGIKTRFAYIRQFLLKSKVFDHHMLIDSFQWWIMDQGDCIWISFGGGSELHASNQPHILITSNEVLDGLCSILDEIGVEYEYDLTPVAKGQIVPEKYPTRMVQHGAGKFIVRAKRKITIQDIDFLLK
jgi:hypothetical protein